MTFCFKCALWQRTTLGSVHSCVLTAGVTFCGCTVSPLYGKCMADTGLKTAFDRLSPQVLSGLAAGGRRLGPGGRTPA